MLGRSILYTILITLLLGSTALAQSTYQVKGVVLDSTSGEPLPFVNIVVAGTQKGTSTDLNGTFTLNIPTDAQALQFSFVGYNTRSVVVSPLLKNMRVKLRESSVTMREITVLKGANPAHRIIKLAVKNKSRNNPENITSFTYQSHSKLIIGPDFASGKPIPKKKNKVIFLGDSTKRTPKMDSMLLANEAKRKKQQENDSLERHEMRRFLDTSYIFINETFTERKYRRPNQSNEKVLATRTSGFPMLALAAVGTRVQPFGFYKDAITLFNKDYVNPVSTGSWRRYDFTLTQTRLNPGGDTTFVIEYQPYDDANIEGLKGQLSINSRGYAIENITATSADPKALTNWRLKQMYEWVNGQYWFPTQLHTDIMFPANSNIDVGDFSYPIMAEMRTFLGKIKTDAGLGRMEFIEEELEIPQAATNPDFSYLNSLRIDTGGRKETNTYKTLDRLVRDSAQGVDKVVSVLEYLAYGAIPIGKLEIPLENLMAVNKVEGLRLGMGLRTNQRFSEWLQFGGFGAYGTKDGRFKYNLFASARISRYFNWHWRLDYGLDVLEPGRPQFLGFKNLLSTEGYRNFIIDRMDYIESLRLSTQFRPFRFTGVELALDRRNLSPSYNYAFLPEAAADGSQPLPFTSFRTLEAQANISLVYGEKFHSIMGRRITLERGYPALYIQAARGLKTDFWGDLEYNRIQGRVELHNRSIFLGNTYLTLAGGITDRAVPYALMFNGMGSRDREIPFAMRNYFQTVGPYEFTQDHFGAVFLYHDFGSLLWKSKDENFAPKPAIMHASGWGSLRSAERHAFINTQSMNAGLHETGLLIRDLYRINYLNAYYYGFGVGAFYRYGPMQMPVAGDNWVFKFSAEISL